MLHNKKEMLNAFKICIAEVEKQCMKKIKIVRSNKCGEYYDRYTEDGQAPGQFARFLSSMGLWLNTCLKSSDHNGLLERRK